MSLFTDTNIVSCYKMCFIDKIKDVSYVDGFK